MENKNKNFNSVNLSESKYQLILKILKSTQDNLGKIIQILEQGPAEMIDQQEVYDNLSQGLTEIEKNWELMGDERVIEGVFDGQKMIANDGQEYQVPANYASKSKLVEGDILKLSINQRGDFKFKQIGPVEREKKIGQLIIDKKGEYFVVVDKKKWTVLPASVSYFKGQLGDEVVILIPKDATSKWAAVENIVRK